MKIAVIGSGGREHALCYKLNKSKLVNEIYCVPGNAGTKKIAKNIQIDFNNFEILHKTLINYKIDLIIVGPEVPLVNGIVDYFEKKKIKIFGPNKISAQLEGSKIFMKKFCKEFNIPTAKFDEVKNLEDAKKKLEKYKFPVVVKSDGLAAGKGVTICKNVNEALRDVEDIINGKFKSSNKVFIEEFLKGEELSYFVISDGENFINLGNAQDHKKIGEGDIGLNTGGMGAYSPSKLLNSKIEKKIIDKIIEPTIRGMQKIKCPFKGILFAGLVIENHEPKLIEYNVRFGDPECQVLMMRLENDLLELILASLNNSIYKEKVKWSEKSAITIVGASKGYPENYKKNVEIKNLYEFEQNENEQIFHAATFENKEGKVFTNGGRVLNSTVANNNLKQARKLALNILDKLDWENKYYRRDIGFKTIK